MDMVTHALIESPRGRFFCATIAYMCSSDQRVARHRRPVDLSDVREVIQTVDTRRISDLAEQDLLAALSLTTDDARYWEPPSDEDLTLAHPEVMECLLPIATAALASPHTHWWAGPVDLNNQRKVKQLPANERWPVSVSAQPVNAGLDRWREHVDQNEASAANYRNKHPDLHISGEWWSTPVPSSALSTSRAHDGLGALELILKEDAVYCETARVWPVHVRNNPRLYEITGPEDWARLVDTYPLPVPHSKHHDWLRATGKDRHWVIPNWPAVADDYDGVHLSLLGYLTTPGIAISLPTSNGATVLAGWDPDGTWWLNADTTTIDNQPATWHRHEGRWLQS